MTFLVLVLEISKHVVKMMCSFLSPSLQHHAVAFAAVESFEVFAAV